MSIFSWFPKKAQLPVLSRKTQLEGAILERIIRDIFVLKKVGQGSPTKEEEKEIEATIIVLKRHFELLTFLFNFLSTKPTVEGGGRTVSPVVKTGIYSNDSIGGSVTIEWPTHSFPYFGCSVTGRKFYGKLTEMSEVELVILAQLVSHGDTRPQYIGPGLVLDSEELTGTEEEQQIAREIERIMRNKIQAEERIFSIDEIIAKHKFL